MYTIVKLIYGVPLYNGNERSEVIEEMIKDRYNGILSFYSGNAPTQPTAFGLNLGSIDEGKHHTEMSSLEKVINVSEDMKKRYQELIDELEEDQKEAILEYGSPRGFLLCTSS